MTADCLLKRFDLVADTPGNIPRLRKLIVDLAVRGKLLKKTNTDASPDELLSRIAVKRESLIKAGKLRKQKPLLPITAEELPAAYSAHCVFERLGNVAILEKGLTASKVRSAANIHLSSLRKLGPRVTISISTAPPPSSRWFRHLVTAMPV